MRKEKLLHPAPTIRGLQPGLLQGNGGSLYYGTGLSARDAVSVGVPFDLLLLILMAEKLRRTFGLKCVYHHIADTHALVNHFCTAQDVDQLAVETKSVAERIADLVNTPLVVKRSSEFDFLPSYQVFLRKAGTDQGEYVRREIADMLWYKYERDVVLKLGWLLQERDVRKGRFDEYLFDREYCRCCGEDMSFAYTVPGRTLDKHRSRVSPYTSVEGETRFLFTKEENVQTKVAHSIELWGGGVYLEKLRSHLEAVMSLWDDVSYTPIPSGDVFERVQTVIELVCRR